VIYFLVVMPSEKVIELTERRKEATERECPECLSQIPIAARRCMFCTSEVPPATRTALADPAR
jgi:large conductance mechanosensitive channel